MRDEGSVQKSPEFEGDSGDMDVEGDMILGDLEPETNSTKSSAAGSPNSKSKPATTTFRPDIDEIVNGIFVLTLLLSWLISLVGLQIR